VPFRALFCPFYGILTGLSAQLVDGPFAAVGLDWLNHLSPLPGNPASARGSHLFSWGVYFLFDFVQ
jgi:hypothetical protein